MELDVGWLNICFDRKFRVIGTLLQIRKLVHRYRRKISLGEMAPDRAS
jgi:hypothetical protein